MLFSWYWKSKRGATGGIEEAVKVWRSLNSLLILKESGQSNDSKNLFDGSLELYYCTLVSSVSWSSDDLEKLKVKAKDTHSPDNALSSEGLDLTYFEEQSNNEDHKIIFRTLSHAFKILTASPIKEIILMNIEQTHTSDTSRSRCDLYLNHYL